MLHGAPLAPSPDRPQQEYQMPHNQRRSAKDVGSQSPAKGSAKKAHIEAQKSGPQSPKVPGVGSQPPQSSGRRSARHEHLPYEAKSFSPEEDPAQQGEAHSKPGVIKEQSTSLQGLRGGGRASGARPNDVEATGRAGEPRSEHTRRGRQQSPGKRS
jgi:hypothetical protein